MKKLILIFLVVTISHTAAWSQWGDLRDASAIGHEITATENYSEAYGKHTQVIYGADGGSFELEVLDYRDDIMLCLCPHDTYTYNNPWAHGYTMSFDRDNYGEDLTIWYNGSRVADIENPNIESLKVEVFGDQVKFYHNGEAVYTSIDNNIHSHLRGIVALNGRYSKAKAHIINYNNGVPVTNTWRENGDNLYYDAGRIGINTDSPDNGYELHVDGDIKASGGDSDNWNEAYDQRGSQIAGIGLEWSANQLNVVSNSGNWDAAYTERGSVIGGTGLSWSGAQLNFDGNLVNGNGIGWSSNSFFVQGDQLAGMGLNWDSSNDKFTIDGAQFEGLGLGWDGSSLFLQGDEVEGHGIGWVSSQFVIDGAALAGAGLGWDGNKFNVSASSPWTSGAGLISYATGKVGIGTTDVGADYIMAVDGEMEVEEITVQVVGVPDYVFHDDYDLKPLDEVADYINQNSHLPEIPSATELEESGMSLGEMNLLLLKKIEELTLHLIGVENRLKQLEKK